MVFCERPLVALQTVGNIHSGALVCHYCMSFCGSPSQALRIGADPGQLQEITTTDPPVDQQSGDYALILCRHKCGQVYCCMECQQDDWEWGGHKELCTGWIDDVNHPLVQFRYHAITSNQIFLLIAKWLARILNENIPYRDNDDHDDDTSIDLHPLVDFSMKLWWEVATLSVVNDPMGYAEMITLDQSCRRLCHESHALLEAAWPEHKGSPWLTPIGFAKLVGSLEQNCVGIRQKHPLRYNIMEDSELRHTYHNHLIKCLENAGLIGNGDDGDDCCEPSDKENQGMQDDATSPTLDTDLNEVNGESDVASLNSKEEWDYSPDEIAEFLSNLANPMNIGSDDEWDSIFTPLDGTAHFALTEKMNHSCEPNVVILYQARGWGRNHPLVAYCIALRDIDQDEELTISYVDADEPYEARQGALANYGFVCTCPKCRKEKDGSEGIPSSGTTNNDGIDEDDLFGTNDTDNDSDQGKDDDECDAGNIEDDDDRLDGDAKLKHAAEQMESIWNKSKYISVPLPSLAPATNYVAQLASSLIKALESQGNDKENNILHLVEQCLHGVRERDFSLCRIVGPELEYQLLGSLQSKGSFTKPEFREAYWGACCTAAIGLAQDGTFSRSLQYLDKAIILGLDRVNLGDFFAYVEMFASQMSTTPCPHAVQCVISDYRDFELQSHVMSTCLSTPIRFPVPTETSYEHFQNRGESPIKRDSSPLVIRGLAKEWPATTLWRNMESMSRTHGHRLVPIELGSILTGMTEELMSFRSFISAYLAKSNEKNGWSLEDAIDPTLQTAYLAQHPLLEQIPEFYQDVDRNPCGIEPTNVNVWIGTGGTRTPLHFDSYDNLLIQLVGVKYVRLYDPNETVRLYVSHDKGYGRQGNMSEVNCELEDMERHPLVRDATFTEVVLFPGDCLFIPSRQWHYVRSLSTSISVNYWF